MKADIQRFFVSRLRPLNKRSGAGWDGCVPTAGYYVCAYYTGFADGLDEYMYILIRNGSGQVVSYGYNIIYTLESTWIGWLSANNYM